MDDEDWTPPTAADLKIIEAKQERSNQISKLMGEYMLKGYRMLDKICHCGTILLQDRNGTDYCVACNELESEFSKDDPVLSSEAARVAAMEGQAAASSSTPVVQHRMALYQAVESDNNSVTVNLPSFGADGDVPVRKEAVASPPATTEASMAAIELRNQIEIAAKDLSDSASIETKIKLCKLIKCASEALSALNKAEKS